MITNVALRQRARRGLEWLKTAQEANRKPGTSVDIKRIDWTNFDMSLSKRCVLGQAVGVENDFWSDGYFETWSFVQDLYDLSDDATTDWMERHGFDLKENRYNQSGPWDRLQAAWLDVAVENKLYKRPRIRKKAAA